MSIRSDIPRYDGHGNVWCFCCTTYLPASRFRWCAYPSKKPGYWSYCRECTRELDKIRYRHSVSTPEGKAKVLAGRYARKERQRATEVRERRAFVTNGLGVLRRRGFTLTDISTLTGISRTRWYGWWSGKNVPTEAAEARIAIVLRETAHMPSSDEMPYRHRKPHPALPLLCKRIHPQLAAHPLRSKWRRRDDEQRRNAA